MNDVRKPTLCVLTTTFPRWDGDREPPFVLELSRRLAAAFRVIVLAPRAPGAAEREKLAGLEVIRYPYAPRGLEQLAYEGGILARLREKPWKVVLVPLLMLGLYRALRRVQRESRVAAIHAHWLFPQGWIATIASLPPEPRLVVTAHGADVFALRGAIWQRVRKRVLRKAARATAVSSAVAEVLRAASPVDRQPVVLPMGVDLEGTFTPGAQVRPGNQLLFVGRLVPKKGAALLLRALAVLAEEGLRPHLTLAGDGPQRAALEALSESLGLGSQVRFLGSVLNAALPDLYRSATLVVVPFVVGADGDQDGLGLVVVEAMGCGCPVAGTPILGINDVVRDGDTAWIAPEATAEALAGTLRAALAQPHEAERRAQKARAQVRARFDWSQIARRYQEILEGSDAA